MAQALALTDQEQVTQHIKKLEPGLAGSLKNFVRSF
jgi:hypothetical protein